MISNPQISQKVREVEFEGIPVRRENLGFVGEIIDLQTGILGTVATVKWPDMKRSGENPQLIHVAYLEKA